MISWIKGELVDLWLTNNKFYIIVNCQGLGYEIQILENIYIKLKTKEIPHQNIVFWLKHIKKEDADYLFGFILKEQKDFFIEILNIKGVGSQIGMALLNKFSIDEIINAIDSKDKKLISSVQGIGQKMTDRIILELKNNLIVKSKSHEEIRNSNADYLAYTAILMLQKKDIDPQEALSLIDLALSQDETNPFAQTALGLFYYNAGEPQRASISLKQAIRKQVKHPLAWVLMIKILRNDQSNNSAYKTALEARLVVQNESIYKHAIELAFQRAEYRNCIKFGKEALSNIIYNFERF